MRLGTKLTVAFGAVTLLPLAPLVVVGREVIGNRYRQELKQQVEEAASQTERDYEAGITTLERSATRLARPADPFARVAELAGSDEGRRVLADLAAQEARSRGLDLLIVVDEQNVVLAAPNDPASEGTHAPLRVLTHGRAQLVEEHPRFVKQGPGRLALEVTRPLGTQGARLVLGMWLDELLPEHLGPSIERVVRPTSGAPSGTLVRTVELEGATGEPLLPVEVRGLDRTLEGALGDLTLAGLLLALGGVAVSLLAGFLVARRITRPLGELAEGADAIARGHRDLALDVQGNDEVASLTRRFNEMVTNLGAAEQSALRAERAAAWRQMAQHLAHELKNPLTPIQMSIETLQRTRARPDRAADFDRLFDESAKVILDEVQRLKVIVGEFSRFARLPAPTLGEVDVNLLCEAACKLYEGSIAVERQLEPGLPPARADRDQLQQVLVNLLENAREAGAHVVVRTGRRGARVTIAVLDDGAGIADSVREHLFQPYATSKPGGTGLGLALVQRIVTEHGGEIEVVEGLPREGGHGAGFVVRLPTSSAWP
ncbi:MAG: ATP-binding protein [Polyangia bacterium]